MARSWSWSCINSTRGVAGNRTGSRIVKTRVIPPLWRSMRRIATIVVSATSSGRPVVCNRVRGWLATCFSPCCLGLSLKSILAVRRGAAFSVGSSTGTGGWCGGGCGSSGAVMAGLWCRLLWRFVPATVVVLFIRVFIGVTVVPTPLLLSRRLGGVVERPVSVFLKLRYVESTAVLWPCIPLSSLLPILPWPLPMSLCLPLALTRAALFPMSLLPTTLRLLLRRSRR